MLSATVMAGALVSIWHWKGWRQRRIAKHGGEVLNTDDHLVFQSLDHEASRSGEFQRAGDAQREVLGIAFQGHPSGATAGGEPKTIVCAEIERRDRPAFQGDLHEMKEGSKE